MAKKRALIDAANDPIVEREITKEKQTKDISKNTHSRGVSLLTILGISLVAGLIGGIVSSRFLRVWFLKI